MKTALITGGAKRIGAQIAQTLHQQGFKVIIHYNFSAQAAEELVDKFNKIRPNSASSLQADLADIKGLEPLFSSIKNLDVLVNNASVFYPTPLNEVTQKVWQEIMNTNLISPFFLAKSLAPALSKSSGCIINIADIYADRPLKNHSIYNISKAGILMMTKTLAQELAPNIRVCAVSPGSILWPENEAELTDKQKQKMLKKIPLGTQGKAKDIAESVLFLINSPYITGQIINVDGGRTLN